MQPVKHILYQSADLYFFLEDFLIAVLSFILFQAVQFAKDCTLVDESLIAHVNLFSSQEQKNFYDMLHFSPLKVSLYSYTNLLYLSIF